MSVTAYYAMAEGKVMEDPVLQAIAASYGKTVPQIVLRWLVQQKNVVALSKTVSEARAKQNFDIFNFRISETDMAKISGLSVARTRLLDPSGLAPDWD